jgi:predicted dehydrogenase
MSDIRIGLVGLGSRGLYHLSLLREIGGYRVVALCDSVAATHAAAREALGQDAKSVRCYVDYEKLLADGDLDAVMLAVRCREQGAMAARALEAGKHVNSEVPAAHSIEDCWRIVLAAERSGKVYQLAEQVRYAGFVEAWRDLVAAGKLGKITLAEGQYLHTVVSKSFREPITGKFVPPDQMTGNAQRQWFDKMPPIHYVVHDLSPLLKIIDDRVVEVTAMSTAAPSATHPQLQQPDMQVALMRTARGAILRMAASFAQHHPPTEYHWLQVIGTQGSVEWKRSGHDAPKMWLATSGETDKRDMDWTWERRNDPQEARRSGHGGLDWHVHASFRDAVLGKRELAFDVYKVMDVAAPSVLAAESIARGATPMSVPDFRPNQQRPKGGAPR